MMKRILRVTTVLLALVSPRGGEAMYPAGKDEADRGGSASSVQKLRDQLREIEAKNVVARERIEYLEGELRHFSNDVARFWAFPEDIKTILEKYKVEGYKNTYRNFFKRTWQAVMSAQSDVPDVPISGKDLSDKLRSESATQGRLEQQKAQLEKETLTVTAYYQRLMAKGAAMGISD